MRIDLKKYLFVGAEKERARFFKEAQEAGIIHFIPSTLRSLKTESADVEHITNAIKILRGLPPAEQEDFNEFELADGIAEKILQLKHRLEQLAEEDRMTNLDISRVAVFGDFSADELKEIEKESGRRVRFFVGKAGKKDDPELPEELIYIASEHNLDYFVSISKDDSHYEGIEEMQIPYPIGELLKRREKIGKESNETSKRLKTYAKYNKFLHQALVYKLNRFNLETAKSYADQPIEQEIFSVDGWVPETKLENLQDLLAKSGIYAEEVAILPEDTIPTCLENTGYDKIGEDVVHVYDTPSHTDKDPSFWVLTFFAMFFAMIVGDAGYGLVFFATALYIRYKHKKMRPLGKRMWFLLLILSSATIFWGLMTNSFFGFRFSPDSPVGKVSLLGYLVEKKAEYHFNRQDDVYQYWIKEIPSLKDVKTPDEFLKGAVKKENEKETPIMFDKFADNIMMELALLVGVIHISISFLRYLDRNWSGIGWIICIIGCYLYFPIFIGGSSIIHFAFGVNAEEGAKSGYYLIWIGFGLAMVLAILRHKLFGLLEAMNVIQIFADTMSYLRLYALGFAGAVVMATINDFASSMNIVFGMLLFLAGHVTNIALGIMAGVIHGLRLNFLEWYHYSFEGGGKKYDPLRKLTYD